MLTSSDLTQGFDVRRAYTLGAWRLSNQARRCSANTRPVTHRDPTDDPVRGIPAILRSVSSVSVKVMAYFEVLDQATMGRLPVQQLTGPRARGGDIRRQEAGQPAEVSGGFLGRNRDDG